jgi:hypothetical protein
MSPHERELLTLEKGHWQGRIEGLQVPLSLAYDNLKMAKGMRDSITKEGLVTMHTKEIQGMEAEIATAKKQMGEIQKQLDAG